MPNNGKRIHQIPNLLIWVSVLLCFAARLHMHSPLFRLWRQWMSSSCFGDASFHVCHIRLLGAILLVCVVGCCHCSPRDVLCQTDQNFAIFSHAKHLYSNTRIMLFHWVSENNQVWDESHAGWSVFCDVETTVTQLRHPPQTNETYPSYRFHLD